MTQAISASATFTKVLIATDFGQQADHALDYAKSIVRHSNGELFLVHVSKPVPHIAIPEASWLEDEPSRAQQEADQTEAAGIALRTEGYHATSLCFFGDIAEEIAEAVRKHDVGLVVVGTHARQGLSRLLIGSQAGRISQALRIPVLFVGPRALESRTEWMPKNMLCGTPLDRHGTELVAYAHKLAKEYGAHLEIAYQAVPEGNKDYDDWLQFKAAIRSLLPVEHGRPPHLHAIFLDEPEADSLIQAVILRKVDLLVIGLRQPSSGWPDLRIAAETPKLLAEVPCPLLAVPLAASLTHK